MALAVSSHVSGRAGAAAITPLRSASPDRKIAGSMQGEETPARRADAPPSPNNADGAQASKLAESLAKVTAGRTNANSAMTPDADAMQAAKKPPAELQREEIKKLEEIRANALYPAPATAEARSIAQLAHTQIIRAQAGLRAFETAEARARADRVSAAQFTAQRAAAAYRELEAFGAPGHSPLHH